MWRTMSSMSQRRMPLSHSSWSENWDNSRTASRYRRQALIFSEIILRVIILTPFLAPCADWAANLSLPARMTATPRYRQSLPRGLISAGHIAGVPELAVVGGRRRREMHGLIRHDSAPDLWTQPIRRSQ